MSRCPRCSETAFQWRPGARFVGGKLRWSRSWHCTNCDLLVEEDGTGLPPFDVRALLLEQQGSWAFARPVPRQALARALSRIVGQDVLLVWKQLRSLEEPVPIGTEAELHWMMAELAKDGFQDEPSTVLGGKLDAISLLVGTGSAAGK